MFKYNNGSDRFMPDRKQQYSFYSMHERKDHTCPVSPDNTDFLEPFECDRLRRKQHRAACQLLSYTSSEHDGGHLLNARDRNRRADCRTHENPAWPVRMVRDRCLVRKSYYASKHIAADILLDMPNLSNDWKTKILDWSATGYLTAGIESSVHLWSGRTQSVQYTINAIADAPNGSAKTTIGCLKWDGQGEKLAYSFTVDGGDSSSSSSSSLSSLSVLSSPSSRSSLSVLSSFPDDRSSMVPDDPNERDGGGLSRTDALENGRDDNRSWAADRPTGKNHFNNYIKVWSLNKQKDDANNETISSTCGCVTLNNVYYVECCVIVMDWLANGRVLVTGCTDGTITFFEYDRPRERLVTLRVIRNRELDSGDAAAPAFVSCLHVSKDRFNRHLAVATYSRRACVLRVWRVEDPPESFPCAARVRGDDPTTCVIRVTEALVDRYKAGGKRSRPKRVIKAFAWHPWKHSLMCYAVSSNVPNPLLADSSYPTWLVLANACSGQVLVRVEQTACNNCSSSTTLAVDVHAMTFSQITGELLVSASTAYKVRKTASSGPGRVIKHSVVVMQALGEIVETLNTSNTEKGLFFTWSPDGSRIALTSTDESLRIWNFFPTPAARKEPDGRTDRNPVTNAAVPANASAQHVDNGYLSDGREGIKHDNWYRNNQPITSELSLGASRVIR